MPDHERRSIETHVEGCDRGCREALAELLRANSLLDFALTLEADAPEPLPANVGRYQILGRLGRGGMGVVFRARDPQLRREVAVKTPCIGSAEALQRFLREARAAAAVRHPNICPIYDVGEDAGRPFVVMALVEGESLADRLRRQGRFESADDAVLLVSQVADALAAVHAASIIHRDLKPGNILLDHSGQPLLADFGLAREDENEHLTRAGAVFGTPAYMPPEQASPELGPMGPWSDQYSLGVILYQLVTGRLPFEASSLTGLIHQLTTKSPPTPSRLRPDIDPALERVIMKAMSRKPRDRYAAVADFAQALRACRRATTPAQPGREVVQRTVTLLSCGCDIFESSAFLELLDPGEQQEVLASFQQLCRETAAPLAGTVVKATDRGMLFCFGVPFAMECASRRAVTAGLNLLERMNSFNARLAEKDRSLRLSARIAVHSGRAAVSESNNPVEPLSIVGQVLPVVDQLEQLTAPDTIVISEDTRQRLRGFVECIALGGQKLKGGTEQMPIWRVGRQCVGGICTEDRPAGLVPLIGREHETALLEDRWRQTLEGLGQVVLLVGPAGIGKSRQVRVLKEFVLGQDAESSAAIVEWPCSPVNQNSGFHPAIDCLNRLLDLGPHEDASRKLEKVAAHLDNLGLIGAEPVALLAGLLSIPIGDRYPPLGMSPARQKEKTFELLFDWIREQAARRPVLFILEDLHWADSVTLEFVEFFVGQSQEAPLLSLLTYRPDFTPPWKNRGRETQVSLSRLNRRQTGELVLFRSGLPSIPQTLLDHIVERGDGVPLFVEELTAMVMETGILHDDDGRVRLADDFDPRAVPASLQDLLMARLDRMSSELEIVQLASAIGRDFSYELFLAAGDWDERHLQQELAKLVDAELLYVRGRPPAAQYQFKHALIQDAAYQTLLKKKRRQFHTRIAEALEQRFPEICANQPELPARHFTEGNSVLKAIAYWEQAGERAQQCGALDEAASRFGQGLELVRTLPEMPARHAQEIKMHVRLAIALQATKGYSAPEVEASCSRAYALCRQTGLTAQIFPALQGLCRYYFLKAEYDRARELAEDLLRLPDLERNPGFSVAAHYALGATLYHQGKHTEALPYLERAVTFDSGAESRAASYRNDVLDPWVIARLYLARVLWLLGYADRAAEECRQALSTAEELDHPFSLCYALSCAAWLHQFRQDRESTRATAARALALAVEKGFPVLRGWSGILCSWAQAEGEQSERAAAEIRSVLADRQVQGRELARSGFLTLLAETCLRAGRFGEGLQTLAQAQDFADAAGEGLWLAEIHRLRGELLLQNPTRGNEAEVSFQQALDIARRQQARSLELRAAMSLARLWREQGKSEAAGALIAEVYAEFTEGFQTHDLQTARSLLAACRSV